MENLSNQPVALTPKMDLCVARSKADEVTIPDVGRVKIKEQRSAVPCRSIQAEIGDIVQEFDGIFGKRPARDRVYCVQTLLLKPAAILHKQKIRSLGQAEEAAIWPYVELMIKDGVVSETVKEPHLVPIFIVLKKSDQEKRPVLDFWKFNTHMQREHGIIAGYMPSLSPCCHLGKALK